MKRKQTRFMKLKLKGLCLVRKLMHPKNHRCILCLYHYLINGQDRFNGNNLVMGQMSLRIRMLMHPKNQRCIVCLCLWNSRFQSTPNLFLFQIVRLRFKHSLSKQKRGEGDTRMRTHKNVYTILIGIWNLKIKLIERSKYYSRCS